tara:strand:+ start:342 stop:671 length:330 start_codon:yes stop_codon:yes gene_type:complete
MDSFEDVTDLREWSNKLTLRAGDLLIDPLTRAVGVLMEFWKEEVTDAYMHPYALGYWKVYWINQDDWSYTYSGETMIEEYGLKMSIAIGIYDLHSSQPCDKEEKNLEKK